MSQSKKLLALVGSARKSGNSATLASAVQRGAQAAGTLVNLDLLMTTLVVFCAIIALVAKPMVNAALAIIFARYFLMIF